MLNSHVTSDRRSNRSSPRTDDTTATIVAPLDVNSQVTINISDDAGGALTSAEQQQHGGARRHSHHAPPLHLKSTSLPPPSSLFPR